MSNTFLARANIVLEWLMAFCGLSLVTIIFMQVVFRYVMEFALLGIEEITVLAGLWLYALGMIHATWNDGHIVGGFLGTLELRPWQQRAMALVAAAACVVVAGVYAYHGLETTFHELLGTRQSAYMRWPYWLWTAGLALAFALMTATYAVQALAMVLQILRSER